MSCPRVQLIVRFVAGELADAEERGVRQHLATCPDCAAAFEDLRGTWEDLGAWNVDLSSTDLTDRVLGQAADQENPIRHPLLTAVLEASQMLSRSHGRRIGRGPRAGRVRDTIIHRASPGV